jgi:hypothetical protein
MAVSKRTYKAIFVENVPASQCCWTNALEQEEALESGIAERSTKS